MWLEVASEGPSGSRRSRARRSTNSPVISPHEFANAVAAVLPFFQKRHEQQDAQEFLRVRFISRYFLKIISLTQEQCALERIQNELATEKHDNSDGSVDGAAAVEDTIVQTVFGGVLWNKVISLLPDAGRRSYVYIRTRSCACPVINTLSSRTRF